MSVPPVYQWERMWLRWRGNKSKNHIPSLHGPEPGMWRALQWNAILCDARPIDSFCRINFGEIVSAWCAASNWRGYLWKWCSPRKYGALSEIDVTCVLCQESHSIFGCGKHCGALWPCDRIEIAFFTADFSIRHALRFYTPERGWSRRHVVWKPRHLSVFLCANI